MFNVVHIHWNKMDNILVVTALGKNQILTPSAATACPKLLSYGRDIMMSSSITLGC